MYILSFSASEVTTVWRYRNSIIIIIIIMPLIVRVSQKEVYDLHRGQ